MASLIDLSIWAALRPAAALEQPGDGECMIWGWDNCLMSPLKRQVRRSASCSIVSVHPEEIRASQSELISRAPMMGRAPQMRLIRAICTPRSLTQRMELEIAFWWHKGSLQEWILTSVGQHSLLHICYIYFTSKNLDGLTTSDLLVLCVLISWDHDCTKFPVRDSERNYFSSVGNWALVSFRWCTEEFLGKL